MIIVVLIVIVAIAGVAYFLALAPSTGGTTTPTSTSTGSTSPQSSTVGTSSSVSQSSFTSESTSPTLTASTTTLSSASTTVSSTSSATTQTLTATCTTTTASSATTTVLALIPWLNAYPSLTLTFNGNTSTMTTSRSFTFSYSVAYVTSTTYKIEGDYVTTKGHQFTSWLLKNGTALAVNFGQGNETGAKAASDVQTYFGEFALVQGFLQEQSLYSNLFRSNGTSTVTFGTLAFTVTNYVALTLPENVQLCNGESDTLTAYNLSEGMPSGSTLELPTYVNIAGTSTLNGRTPFGFTVQITALTVA
jgi:hypothetical protein